MKNRIIVVLMFAIVFPAIAQQRPSDAKLLHDVSAVLENEKAFRGLLIVPKVNHGTVTLTGNVSSDGDKVLASVEVGQVDGVKTVLNNLVVGKAKADTLPALANSEGAQVQALTAEQRAAKAPTGIVSKTVTIPQGSLLQIRLNDSLSTKTAKADDHFHGVLAAPIYAGGLIAIPQGTPVVGRVAAAKSAGHFVSAAELSLELTGIWPPSAGTVTAFHGVGFSSPPDGQYLPLGIVTEQLSSNGNSRTGRTIATTGGGAAGGAIIGALAGGGPGAAIGAVSGGALGLGSNAVTRGGQIELKPETLLRFRTAAPIVTTIYEKDGKQIQLPPASGTELRQR